MKNLLKNIVIFALFIFLLIIGRSVFVYHFFNENIVKLPKLVGMTKQEATEVLNNLKLNPVFLDGVSTFAAHNTVLTQYPEANSNVKQKRNIQLLINSGKPKIVPDIINTTLIKAKRKLEMEDIKIDRVDYYPYKGEKDIVLSVYPNINKPLRHNQGVSLLISSSVLSTGDIMPNLVGLTIEQAIFLLVNTGHKIKDITYISDENKEQDTIVSTTPQAGEKVNNQKISIVINRIDKSSFDDEIDKIIKDNLEELKKGKNEVSSNTED